MLVLTPLPAIRCRLCAGRFQFRKSGPGRVRHFPEWSRFPGRMLRRVAHQTSAVKMLAYQRTPVAAARLRKLTRNCRLDPLRQGGRAQSDNTQGSKPVIRMDRFDAVWIHTRRAGRRKPSTRNGRKRQQPSLRICQSGHQISLTMRRRVTAQGPKQRARNDRRHHGHVIFTRDDFGPKLQFSIVTGSQVTAVRSVPPGPKVTTELFTLQESLVV
jgi:hypothetical protein